jgi:hypothetical protein
MTSRKPTSDEQFGVVNPDDEGDCFQGPKSELDQLFDHHGYNIIEGPDPFGREEEDNG